MKKTLEDSWQSIDTAVSRNAYTGADGWKFVVLVCVFLAVYVGLTLLGLRIPEEVGFLAGLVVGNRQARTYRQARSEGG